MTCTFSCIYSYFKSILYFYYIISEDIETDIETDVLSGGLWPQGGAAGLHCGRNTDPLPTYYLVSAQYGCRHAVNVLTSSSLVPPQKLVPPA